MMTSVLSNYLHSAEISIGNALTMAKSCQRLIKSRRNDEFFNVLWQKTQEKVNKLGLSPPKLPRKKFLPKRIDDGYYPGDHQESIQRVFKAQFSEALDTLVTQIELRFNENDLSTLNAIESVFLNKVDRNTLMQKTKDIQAFCPCHSSSLHPQLEIALDLLTANKCDSISNVISNC